jgi:uncharacterized protein (DUF924 family)
MDWAGEILDFWFGLDPGQYWKADPALDAEIGERFGKLWRERRDRVPVSFLADARSAVAAVILFDQFPRNMFRGHADQFSTDPLALAIARGAIDCKLDEALDAKQRAFLYMPFMHSENPADQLRSLLLFTALGDSNQLDFAKRHQDVIARFGRFPHRNAMLGRMPRPGEEAAGDAW